MAADGGSGRLSGAMSVAGRTSDQAEIAIALPGEFRDYENGA